MDFNSEDFRNEKFVIHCPTKDEAIDCVAFLYDQGFEWAGGAGRTTTNWKICGERTAYMGTKNGYLMYGTVGHFIEDRNTPPILFSETNICPQIDFEIANDAEFHDLIFG